MALYSEKVMDHFRNPRNVGKLEDADGVGEVGNAKCGDIMRMYLKVDPETKVITDVKFNTFGCGSAIATSSMATELIKGKTLDQALAILMNTPKAAAPIVAKVLNSAIANAENNLELDRSTLYVAECYANQGPTLKRFHPRSRGQAFSILKRSSHITVVLDQK